MPAPKTVALSSRADAVILAFAGIRGNLGKPTARLCQRIDPGFRRNDGKSAYPRSSRQAATGLLMQENMGVSSRV